MGAGEPFPPELAPVFGRDLEPSPGKGGGGERRAFLAASSVSATSGNGVGLPPGRERRAWLRRGEGIHDNRRALRWGREEGDVSASPTFAPSPMVSDPQPTLFSRAASYLRPGKTNTSVAQEVFFETPELGASNSICTALPPVNAHTFYFGRPILSCWPYDVKVQDTVGSC